ncbi:N-acetylmuramoyl-L-alanine amidase [Sulfobacillus sp. hq2]|uniref:N-acetylmuramoyl-L-alanine amidase family protein n=1 Tax=Sulfobacillus sp. hq2 TaxID=2039167 RepID=UPI000CD2BAE3|nr:N-acetylmuramoyl-L-alanine amidase [Sulfobacillus sp. hq2]POB11240.1 cell wall hydrolase [Sulfobacillus sp. hq2]
MIRRVAAMSPVLALVALFCASLVLWKLPHESLAVHGPLPVVVIDPGHGGPDPGAIAGPTGPYEKNINLAIALTLSTFLQSNRIQTYLTRTTDQAVSPAPYHSTRDLHWRAALSRHWHAAIFVSIHTNAEPTAKALGPIVYYRAGSRSSYALAQQVASSLAPLAGRLVPPRPIRQLVLQETGVPAINVEVGFITHPLDQSRLVNSAYQIQLARAINQGITRYLALDPQEHHA